MRRTVKVWFKPGPFTADHDSGKNLDPLLVAFAHAGVDAHPVAHFEFRDVGLLLLFAMVSMMFIRVRSSAPGKGRIRSATKGDCKGQARRALIRRAPTGARLDRFTRSSRGREEIAGLCVGAVIVLCGLAAIIRSLRP